MAATPDETLAEERQRSTKAAAIAILAGLLTLLGSALVIAATSGAPIPRLLDTLRANLGQAPPGPGPVAKNILFLHDNLVLFAGAGIVTALATAAAGTAMTYLFRSVRARNPQVSKVGLVVAVSGSVLAVVAATAGAVSLASDLNSFADSARQSEAAARDALSSFTLTARQLAGLGSALLGVGITVTALNAMRVGLLTRFSGVLGVIVGALYILPLEGGLPIVRVFWLVALGLLFLGRWPGGMPPAWVTGEAQPWPTQQELRERRDAARAERGAAGLEEKVRRPRRGRAEPPETPAPEPPRTAKPHSSSKKKKRKRH